MTGLVLGWDADRASRQGIGFVRGRTEDRTMPPSLIEDTSEAHCICIAPTGSGKGVSLIIPNLLHYDGPVIVVDVKGENAQVTAKWRRELGQRVVVLDPWGIVSTIAARFNPFDVLNDHETLVDDAYALAALLRDPRGSPRDPFWEERAQTLIAACIVHLVHAGLAAERNLGGLWRLLNAEDTPRLLAMLLDDDTGGAMHPFARGGFAAFVSTTEVTRSGILATAQSMVRVFASRKVQHATDETSFPVEAVRDGDPMSLYLVVPPSKLRSHAALVRCWVATLMGIITSRRTRPERETLFILDECAALGEMDEIRTALTLARGYGLRAMLILQSHAQLRHLYPDHETLMENAGIVMSFGHTSRTMSVHLADALGDISADALYRMEKHEMAMKTAGSDTRIVRKLNYLTDPAFADRASPNTFYLTKCS